MSLHPRDVLFADGPSVPIIPACEHFAGSEKFVRKALALQAAAGPVFDITIDLEDGAAAGSERAAAAAAAAMVMSEANRFDRVGIRTHDPSHAAWKADAETIVAAAGARLAYIAIPKVTSRMDALATISYIYALAEDAGLRRHIPIHCVIETHQGLREVHAIAELPAIESVVFGLLDFVSSHHGAIPAAAMESPGQFDHPLVRRAKVEIAAAALGHARVPTHNITTELADHARIEADARRAREEFGYLRMYSIHPNQIEPILAGMRASAHEIELAADILLAASDADWAPIRMNGKLYDRGNYRYYWQILERAHTMAADIPPEARRRFLP